MVRINLIIYLIFLHFICFSQQVIVGRVVDAVNNNPLAFASIQIQNTTKGTISDNDGNFKLWLSKQNLDDTLIISYLGFQKKHIIINQLKNNVLVKLTASSCNIEEISVNSYTNNYISKYLYKLILNYRFKELYNSSKVFFRLTSYNDSIPIEVVEAFYNSKISKSRGLSLLELKMGRFGHNSQLSFYSLNTTNLILDYGLYLRRNTSILPLWPGKMNLRKIRKNYFLTYTVISNSSHKISFVSKTEANLFNGYIIFNPNTLNICKIELYARNPIVDLKPINTQHSACFKDLQIALEYNSENLNLLKYISLKYDVKYTIKSKSYDIATNALLLFYDYNSKFISPFFTSKINLSNDYLKIAVYGFNADFWEENYNLPTNKKIISAFKDFLIKGDLVNFSNNLGIINESCIKKSLIEWRLENRIKWEDFNYNTVDFGISEKEIKDEHGIYTPSDLYNLDFTYFINPLILGDNKYCYITNLFFNKFNSYYFLNHDEYTLAMVNIIFDMYGLNLLKLNDLIEKQINTPYELCMQISKESAGKANEILLKTEKGQNIEELLKYNNIYYSKTDINNIPKVDKIRDMIIHVDNADDFDKTISNYNIGTALYLKNDFKGAILYFNKAFGKGNIENDLKKDILYNRAQAYFELGDMNKACIDLSKASILKDEEAKKIFNIRCKN